MSDTKFEMVAKTFQGLEGVLADELTALGADDVAQGRRMVRFKGDKRLMYQANFSLRTALRVLKPIYKFRSTDADDLYAQVRQFEWDQVIDPSLTFAIDSTVFSDSFRHSRFVTYRVKDAIADYFKDKVGRRPSISVTAPNIRLDVHISGDEVTISLDSSGEPLYKRGWRVYQTDAPINAVLAAGIIKLSGWDGNTDLIDPMCGSGTFLVEAALIAANINPGVYREGFAFQNWADYDADMFSEIYNDDSQEREFAHKIYGYDINKKAVAITMANVKNAGVGKLVQVEQRALEDWTEAPAGGTIITNPPYGERLKVDNIEALYATLGTKLKKVFTGYNAWVIGYDHQLTDQIGLRASVVYPLLNGELECELRQYVIFEGKYSEMRAEGGHIKNEGFRAADKDRGSRRPRFEETRREGGKPAERRERRPADRGDRGERKFDRSERKPARGDKRPDERRTFNGPDGMPRTSDDEFYHSEKFANMVVKHREPTLGKDKEVPIVKGRRNGWKRRDK